MRIIGFSNAAPAPALPFWITPVQALLPWLSRIKDSLGHLAHEVMQEVQQPTKALRHQADGLPAFTSARPASNDPVFTLGRKTDGQSSTTTTGQSHALRVVRESDAALKADCAGRMVMSGKIADICAELDRMALRAARAER